MKYFIDAPNHWLLGIFTFSIFAAGSFVQPWFHSHPWTFVALSLPVGLAVCIVGLLILDGMMKEWSETFPAKHGIKANSRLHLAGFLWLVTCTLSGAFLLHHTTGT